MNKMDVLTFENLKDGECIIDTSKLKKNMIINVSPSMLRFFEDKIKNKMLYPFIFQRYGCLKDEEKLEVVGYLFKVDIDD